MNRRRNKAEIRSNSSLRILCTGLWLCSAVSTASAANLMTGFSSSDNPNGNWTYGWTSSLGDSFNTYVNNENRDGIDFWYDWYGSGVEGPDLDPHRYPSTPFVAYNGSSTREVFHVSDFPAGSVILMPGAFTEYSVVRWTAPATQTVRLFTTFSSGAIVFWPTADVHVLLNGRDIYSELVGKNSEPHRFDDTLSLNTGDTLDFAVGPGNSGSIFDSVVLDVTISAVPEPKSWATLALGLSMLAASSAWRRRIRAPSR